MRARNWLLIQVQPGSTAGGTVVDPDEWIEGAYLFKRSADRAAVGRLQYVIHRRVWDARL